MWKEVHMQSLHDAQNKAVVFLTASLLVWGSIVVYQRMHPAASVIVRRVDREEQDAFVRAEDEKVDINSASAEELTSLKGLGPVLAKRIVEYRRLNGRFYYTDEIRRVKGIGKGLFNKIKDGICAE